MYKKVLLTISLAILILIPLIITGCSGEEKTEENTENQLPEYPNWTTYTYRSFVYHFRRDASWRDKMDQLSGAFENALKQDCGFFNKPAPAEPIHVFIYNTPDEAKTLIGKPLPYVTDNQIHWERITVAYGAGIMMYLLEYWGMDDPKYIFMKEGMIALRDYSRRDYHEQTGRFINEGFYLPLDTLINNDVYLQHESQLRSWEAASLVAFMTLNFGVDNFLKIWDSDKPFAESIREYARIDLHQFEHLWNQYAIQEYQKAQENK